MSVTVAKSAGFCFGVNRAVELVEKAAKEGGRVCTLGPIIHNRHAVDHFAKMGVRVIEDPKEAAPGQTVIIRSHGVTKQVYEQLKDDIINHRIGFGEKLVNRELQKRFGISSTPVRDAINHLQLDGLLEEITNVGARVVSFDLDFTRELNELVLLLNLGATDLIIQNGRLGELTATLEEIYAEWASIRCMDDYVRLDRLFHQAFFTHCGNRRLVDVYGRYHVLMEMLVRLYAGDNEQRSACINQHEQILKFCRNICLLPALIV